MHASRHAPALRLQRILAGEVNSGRIAARPLVGSGGLEGEVNSGEGEVNSGPHAHAAAATGLAAGGLSASEHGACGPAAAERGSTR